MNTPPKSGGAKPRALMDDDRPTEINRTARSDDLHTSREQHIEGTTIREMIRSQAHLLSGALQRLVEAAKKDLPGAAIDHHAQLKVQHEFEFERRVGFRLELRIFDPEGRCVLVKAELDQDGSAIRRGSLIAKII